MLNQVSKKFLFVCLGCILSMLTIGAFAPKETLDVTFLYTQSESIEFFERLSEIDHYNYIVTEIADVLFLLFYTGFFILSLKPKTLGTWCIAVATGFFDLIETVSILTILLGLTNSQQLFYLPYASALKWTSTIIVFVTFSRLIFLKYKNKIAY
jgi:hypothetical protein